MKYPDRLDGLDESATFKYSNLASAKKTLNLTIGRTNFDTPKAIKEATKKALDEGKVNYTPTKGIPELRKKIAEKLTEENRIPGIDEDRVLVSCGAKQVLYEAFMALVGNGDVVALPDPSWVSYAPMVRLAGGKPVGLKLKPENGFIPDEQYLSELENTKAKVMLVNSPSNPTGAVYPEKTLREIADIAQRKDCVLISDEIYERIIYEGKHFSPASLYDNTITINGFSKEYSMTGWRLGYAASQVKEHIEMMDRIQAQSVSCATSFIQYGAVCAFGREARKEVDLMVEELRRRRDRLAERLEKTKAVLVKPKGAFYMFPYFEGEDDIELADRLLENGVGVIPGSPFGSQGKGCLRLSYGAASMDDIDAAAEIIGEVI